MSNLKKIVFTTWGSYGDIHPFMALARELQGRGHRTAIATLSWYREKIESAGIEFYPLRPDALANNSEEENEIVRRILDLREGPRYVMREILSPHIRASYHDTMNAVLADGGADVLVSHAIPMAAPIVAEITGVKWISSVLSPMSLPSVYDPPTPPEFPALRKLLLLHPSIARGFIGLLRRMTESWIKPVRELRRELDLAPGAHPVFEGQFSPRAVLALFSKVLAKQQPDYPPNTVITGFPFYDAKNEQPAPRELMQFLENGEAPILFTLGSAAVRIGEDFFRTSIEVARRLNRRALLLVSDNSSIRGDLPNGIGVFNYAPHSVVMPRASVVVHQAGIGTTGQALQAGRPMLIVPYGQDQPDNARRCVELGLGQMLPQKDYNFANALEKLEQILRNPVYAANARKVSVRLLREDGTKTACDVIEGVLSDVAVGQASQQRRGRVAFPRLACDAV